MREDRVQTMKSIHANAICIAILILIVWGSVWQSYYVFSPNDWALMLSNAKDLYNGKLPYKDIFIQYGIFTTVIHALAYGWGGGNQISIITITAIAYATGLWLLYRATLALTGDIKLALYVFVTCFLIHPIAIYPWSNYIAFPFLVYGISMLINNPQSHRKNLFTGIAFGLAILSREGLAPAIILLIIFSTLLDSLQPEQNRKNSLTSAALITSGLLLPLAGFFFYLVLHDLLPYWYKLSWLLPRIYMTTIFPHVSGFGIFNVLLITIWRGSMLWDYRWLLLGMVIAVNLYLVILMVTRRKLSYLTPGIAKIAFAALLLLSSAVHLAEIFRLATGSVIGVITFYVVLNHYKQASRAFIVVLGSLGSTLIWFNSGNYFLPSLDAVKSTQVVTNPFFFRGQRWPEHVIQYYQNIDSDLKNLENSQCGIAFHYNYTYDAYLQVLSPFVQYQIAPFGAPPKQINDAFVSINALRPDFDLRKKIDAASDIILFLHLPEKDFASYKPPAGFSVYSHYAMHSSTWNDFPEGNTLLILAPRICLEPLQRAPVSASSIE